MRLIDLKTQALRYVVLGDLGRAFLLYEAIIAALPSDLDARMKVADLCVTAGLPELARRVYAAVAYYDVQGGRPLHALVACQALRDLGAEATSLVQSLAELYGAGSKRLGQGGAGARLAPPDPESDVPAPTLAAAIDPASAAASAAERAADTTSLTDFPAAFPPVPLLSEVSPTAFVRILGAARVHRLAHGARVLTEGDPGRSFFLVASGHTRVYLTAAGVETDLARLGEGALFGELALISAQPRTASVAVAGEADLIELGTEALRAAAGELPQLAEILDRFARERLLRHLLATSPLFRPFSPTQRLDLARRFTGHDVAPGQLLIREGDVGRGLYVILAGGVEVVRGNEPFENIVATLRAGDLFGEIALIRNTPATATVRASQRGAVLFLAREYFERLVEALPTIRAYFEGLTEERLRDLDLEIEELHDIEPDETESERSLV